MCVCVCDTGEGVVGERGIVFYLLVLAEGCTMCGMCGTCVLACVCRG